MRHDRAGVERSHPQAEVIHVAALRARRRAALSAQHTVHRHEVDERVARAQLQQSDLLLEHLDAAAEDIAIEIAGAVQVGDAQHDVIEAEDLGCAHDGLSLPR